MTDFLEETAPKTNIKDAATKGVQNSVEATKDASEKKLLQEISTVLNSKPMLDKLALASQNGVKASQITADTLILLNKNPYLLTCTRNSLFSAVYEAANLKLRLNPSMGQACIVPRNVKKKFGNQWTTERVATFQIMYQGLIDLMYRVPETRICYAEVVYRGDVFEYEYGTNQYLRHKPLHETTKDEDIVAAYFFYESTRGGKYFEVMTVEQLEQVRQLSADPESAAWKNSRSMMYRKTVARRGSKFVPKLVDAELQVAVSKDEQFEEEKAIVKEGEETPAEVVDAKFEDIPQEESKPVEDVSDKNPW